MKRFFGRGRYANVTATIALIVAMGGTSYAALSANTVGKKQIKKAGVGKSEIAKNAVTSPKVKNGALKQKDFAAGQIPTGPQGDPGPAGPQGDPGPQGVQGEPATRLFAAINGGAVPTFAKNSGNATTVDRTVGVGQYRVFWDRNVSACVWIVTPGGSDAGGVPPNAYASVHQSSAGNTALFVQLRNDAGANVDEDFSVAVFC